MKVYLKDKKCIAFYNQKATADFWDDHWLVDELENKIRQCTYDRIFSPVVEEYLPKGSRILEGGCGTAHIVNALSGAGYDVTGIDFAEKTVKAVNKAVPELDVQIGDVMDIPFPDNAFDGYVSGGVIEHFWDGYESIIAEVFRVLKPGGYLFITFPYMSPIRRIKSHLGRYPVKSSTEMSSDKELFYQFALGSREVFKEIENVGFKCVQTKPLGGLKGAKDEIPMLQLFLQKMYNDELLPKYRGYIDRIFKSFSAHIIQAVFVKID